MSTTSLAIRVLQAFSAALEQPDTVFEPIYGPAPNQLIKLIRYPGREPGESDQGVGAHKDSGFVSILLQDRVGGLQVEGEHGWIDTPPVPGTFVVNTGELLEIASNGFLRANVHRVVSPPAGGDRLSVAFFLGARLDSEVPLSDVASAPRGPLARSHAGSGQSALPRRWPQLPQKPSSFPSRRRARASCRSDRAIAGQTGARFRLLTHFPQER